MAGFADILKRLKPTRFPKIPRKLIEWTLYTLLSLALAVGGTGVILWNVYQPEIQKLKEKDPEGFEEMRLAFKDLDWPKAWKEYQRLDRMTMNEVYRLRYEKWKIRWQEDPEFREKQLEDRANIHDDTQVRRLQGYQTRRQNLQSIRRRPQETLKELWDRATPWQKGLILWEGCVRYLRRESRELARRLVELPPPEYGPRPIGGRVVGVSPAERCDAMVRVADDPAAVEESLQRLKSEMNYFYFSRFMNELGLSRETLMTVGERAVKMAEALQPFQTGGGGL